MPTEVVERVHALARPDYTLACLAVTDRKGFVLDDDEDDDHDDSFVPNDSDDHDDDGIFCSTLSLK
jgi:hypothetical protein